jgi:Fe2+ transport system protein FeoA
MSVGGPGLDERLVTFGAHDSVEVRVQRSDLLYVRADDLFGRDST